MSTNNNTNFNGTSTASTAGLPTLQRSMSNMSQSSTLSRSSTYKYGQRLSMQGLDVGSLSGSTDLTGEKKNRVPHTKSDDKEALLDAYELGNKLGRGAFGTVRLIKEKSSRITYAVKIVKKNLGSISRTEQMQREVAILKRVRHPYIVQLKEVFETPKRLYMIMEYCAGGELVTRMKQDQITEEDVRTVVMRLVDAVAYLHDNGVVHRDLKPENILLSGDRPDTDPFDLRISDFGLATYVGVGGDSAGTGDGMMDNQCGTAYYMAPEIFGSVGYSKQCDIWSIGIIMYLAYEKGLFHLTIRFGRFQRDCVENLRLMVESKRITFHEPHLQTVSSQAKHLLSRMLQIDPAQRATAKEILDHSWVTGDMYRETTTGTVLQMMRTYNNQRILRRVFLSVYALCILNCALKRRSAANAAQQVQLQKEVNVAQVEDTPRSRARNRTTSILRTALAVSNSMANGGQPPAWTRALTNSSNASATSSPVIARAGSTAGLLPDLSPIRQVTSNYTPVGSPTGRSSQIVSMPSSPSRSNSTKQRKEPTSVPKLPAAVGATSSLEMEDESNSNTPKTISHILNRVMSATPQSPGTPRMQSAAGAHLLEGSEQSTPTISRANRRSNAPSNVLPSTSPQVNQLTGRLAAMKTI